MSKLLTYSERKTFCFSEKQIKTFEKMKSKYKIDVSDFVRQAIKEKIERDLPKLIEKQNKRICPFSGKEY